MVLNLDSVKAVFYKLAQFHGFFAPKTKHKVIKESVDCALIFHVLCLYILSIIQIDPNCIHVVSFVYEWPYMCHVTCWWLVQLTPLRCRDARIGPGAQQVKVGPCASMG